MNKAQLLFVGGFAFLIFISVFAKWREKSKGIPVRWSGGTPMSGVSQFFWLVGVLSVGVGILTGGNNFLYALLFLFCFVGAVISGFFDKKRRKKHVFAALKRDMKKNERAN